MIDNYKIELVPDELTVLVDLSDGKGMTDGVRVILYNETHGSHHASLGGEDLTLTNGMHIYGGEKLALTVENGEILYAMADEIIDIRIFISGLKP